MYEIQVLGRAGLYSEGVASHSPGLPASAGYPGNANPISIYPERVAAFENHQ